MNLRDPHLEETLQRLLTLGLRTELNWCTGSRCSSMPFYQKVTVRQGGGGANLRPHPQVWYHGAASRYFPRRRGGSGRTLIFSQHYPLFSLHATPNPSSYALSSYPLHAIISSYLFSPPTMCDFVRRFHGLVLPSDIGRYASGVIDFSNGESTAPHHDCPLGVVRG